MAEHPYSEVPTWGHSGSSFVLHVGNLVRQNKIYFHTEQVRDAVASCARAWACACCGLWPTYAHLPTTAALQGKEINDLVRAYVNHICA